MPLNPTGKIDRRPPMRMAEYYRIPMDDRGRYHGSRTVLSGDVAEPCTRNPLQRG